MKVKWIAMKSLKDNFGVLDLIANMKPKEWEFLKAIISASQDDLFISSSNKEAIMQKLSISEPTYFNRLKSLEEAKIIMREIRGVYKFNEKWIKLITLEIKVIGAEKQSVKSNQKLLNLKF